MGISKRFFSSLVLIGVGVATVFFKPVCLIVVTFFILVGLWEFFNMVEKKGVTLFKGVGLVLGGLIPVSIFFRFPITREFQLFFILLGLFSLFFLEFTRSQNQEAIFSISATIFGVLYVAWCLSFFIRIRNLEGGAGLSAFLLLVVKAQDVGAYIIGSLIGRRPLFKRISPNKTLEGALGGVIFSIVFSFIFKGFLDSFRLSEVLILGFILGVVGILGDLFESLLKRDCGIKDASFLIPGIGGALDLLDSLMFSSPVFYFFVVILR